MDKNGEKENELYEPQNKRQKIFPNQSLYLESLPDAHYYEHSYMHRDIVSHICVSKTTEFIITASVDGHVKFWKKMMKGIEFVKHYQAHLGPIHSFEMSPDEKQIVSTSSDKMIKFFDVLVFDLSNMIKTDYLPYSATWLTSESNISNKVAISDKDSPKIRIYDANSDSSFPLHSLDIHSSPIRCMALNSIAHCVISIDSRGIIEYWDCQTFEIPKKPIVNFELKTETDLYDMAKTKSSPLTLSVSPNGRYFAVFSKNKKIRLFDFRRGKLSRIYDESVNTYKSGKVPDMDELELGRRQAVERELESSIEPLSYCKIQFDESGNFLIYGSLRGIKIVNIETNKLVRLVGDKESAERFLGVYSYQGIPKVDAQLLLSRAEADKKAKEDLSKIEDPIPDPTFYCTSFKRRRFYCLSSREPDESEESRDKFNELPTEEEKSIGHELTSQEQLPDAAVIRTTIGDIFLKLFPKDCPRTVENFTTHIKNGYYNNVIFHRVIKGFMIQTGDPLGDGTGGESIWGGEFEDEFVRTLRHDRPYTLSMANAGPNTNGSQFFITTVPTPWLDNKHTVFGRVSKGFEVVTKIESVKVNKLDKPYEDIKIISAEIVKA